jgi:hypothetical protein
MLTIHPQYNTDSAGKKLSVVLPIKDFNALIEQLDELEDIKLCDEAQKANEPSFPADDAFKMIEEKRKAN